MRDRSLGPIFLARGFAAVFRLAHLAAAGGPVRSAGHRDCHCWSWCWLRSTPGGYVFFSLGMGHAGTAIVAAASAPYAVMPILVVSCCSVSARRRFNGWACYW